MFNFIKKLFKKETVTIEIGDTFIHNDNIGWEVSREDVGRITITNVNTLECIFVEYTRAGCDHPRICSITDINEDYTKEMK